MQGAGCTRIDSMLLNSLALDAVTDVQYCWALVESDHVPSGSALTFKSLLVCLGGF